MTNKPDKSQKTEEPTAKRKQESAKRGDVTQSREAGVAMITIAAMGWFTIMGGEMFAALSDVVRRGLTIDPAMIAGFDPMTAMTDMILRIVPLLGGFLLVTVLAAAASVAMLGSLGFRTAAMAFKGSRINPVSGLGRIFGRHGLIELVKAIAKVVLLGGITAWVVADFITAMAGVTGFELATAISQTGWSMIVALWILMAGLVVIAMIDIPAQMMLRRQRLMMTKQEVKQENRESEGSPELKSAVRRRQYEVLNNSTRKAVQDATVVLTNPTHFAVALRYRPGEDAAPIVVARSRGANAEAVRQLAKEAQVPMLSYPELTRAIYYTSRTGSAIREDLYLAVAVVMGFVLSLERQMQETPPPVEVPPQARFDAHGRAV